MVKPTSIAQPMHLYHYLAVANTHILLDKAVTLNGDQSESSKERQAGDVV